MHLLGIPIAPLLASAGVAGVALGFGAQSLVKDFLSGIFMIFEDQYGVGDVIDTGEAVGTVEEVTLRITRLRDANGVTWYVRNGEIIRVGNRSQGFATAIVDMPVSYAENVERVVGVIRETATAMGRDPDWADKFVEEPQVLGVESIVGMTMTIRTIAQCVPGENFAVQREMRERLKARARRRRRQGAAARPVRRTRGRTPVSLYDEVGGAPTFEALVHAFYEGVAADPPLRALYPEDDLAPAERRLRMFLTQYFGGPDHLQRGARPPPAADAARALPGDPRHARPVDAAHARRDGHPRPAGGAGRADARLLPAGRAHARQHRRDAPGARSPLRPLPEG